MKKLFLSILISVSFIALVSSQPIRETTSPRGWQIKTKSSVYQIVVNEKDEVNTIYFGAVEQQSALDKNKGAEYNLSEVPCRGGWANKTPIVEVIFPNGTRDCELVFESSKISQDEFPVLEIVLKDKFNDLRVKSYIKVYPDYDLLEKWIVLENTGNKNILIENAMSASIALQPDNYELTHFSGIWGHEFTLEKTKLTPGVKTIKVDDFKSYIASWFGVTPFGNEDITTGSAYFGTLHYSGNWRIDIDKKYNGRVQVVAGINFWDTHWNLEAGETFTTPKFTFGYSNTGLEGASHKLHKYTNDFILPRKNETLPVLYNSWYATTFDVNEEHQLELAKIAKDIGVELFVIDDGWFKGRINGSSALGDWVVDKNKFPNGLNPMIEKINAMGMDFGIWVEPEMVNPNSDLFRAHPDWALHYPNHTRNMPGRQQQILNFAREDVYEYILESLSEMLKNHNIKFVKWDHNRHISEAGWPDAPAKMQREVRIRYQENLYRMVDELRRRYPDVIFENCSSGGGRIDLGMLSRMEQAWVTDNTDAIDRIFIHYGYLQVFPARTMVSWVTHEDWHKMDLSLKFKFDVSMAGVLGVGNPLTHWDVEDIKVAKERIALYKKIRNTVQLGTAYRLVSPYTENRSALQYVNRDKSEAVLFMYNLAEYMKNSTSDFRKRRAINLRGLDPNSYYKIEGDHSGVYKGDKLMTTGLPWFLKGGFNSAVLILKKVEN